MVGMYVTAVSESYRTGAGRALLANSNNRGLYESVSEVKTPVRPKETETETSPETEPPAGPLAPGIEKELEEIIRRRLPDIRELPDPTPNPGGQ